MSSQGAKDFCHNGTDTTVPAPTGQPLDKAERVEQLNQIDQSVARLLRSAGLALEALTVTFGGNSQPSNRQEAFTVATDKYLDELHAVSVQIKRQISGLAEAGIISQGKTTQARDERSRNVTRSSLDVAWLNSRSGKVGKDMEADLCAQAIAFTKELKSRDDGAAKDLDG